MEAKEIYEKIKSGQATYEDLLNWCNENKENMNLNNSYEYQLYNAFIIHSMQSKALKLNSQEASVYCHFFAKKIAHDMKMNDKVTVKVLNEEQYKEINEDNSEGICIPNEDGTYTVAYNFSKLEKKLTSNDKYDFIDGLQTIFHELRHVMQNQAISMNRTGLYKKSIYIMALDTITRKTSSKFYKENYAHLLKENDANKYGLQLALETIKKRNPNLYSQFNHKKIEILLKRYDNNFYDSDFEIHGYKGSAIKSIDSWSEYYINEHPEVIEQYPVLKVAYNKDGRKKDILQMLKERDSLVLTQPKDTIDELYKTIMNQKFFDKEEGISTEGELLALDKWVEETGTDDPFIYDLIRYRLDRSELTDEEKDKFISDEMKKAKKIRNEEEQEKNPQKEESIKDEVGAEEIKDEQEEEQVWIKRMQLCYSKSTHIDNYPAKQKDLIKTISEQLREKDQKEIDEYMGKE